jgi:hypothetical protein
MPIVRRVAVTVRDWIPTSTAERCDHQRLICVQRLADYVRPPMLLVGYIYLVRWLRIWIYTGCG